jgi:hypothetical protein
MPPLDPEELLEQARRLAAEPTQADLRRAISAAYYGLFHFFLTAAADMIVFFICQTLALAAHTW